MLANKIGPVKKLKGPGRVFAFRLPKHPSDTLNFLIQGRAIVDVHFGRDFDGELFASTFAIMALDVLKTRDEQRPEPPYPRPSFHSLEELSQVLNEIYSLAELAASLPSS